MSIALRVHDVGVTLGRARVLDGIELDVAIGT
jgi:hypothetical protein